MTILLGRTEIPDAIHVANVEGMTLDPRTPGCSVFQPHSPALQ